MRPIIRVRPNIANNVAANAILFSKLIEQSPFTRARANISHIGFRQLAVAIGRTSMSNMGAVPQCIRHVLGARCPSQVAGLTVRAAPIPMGNLMLCGWLRTMKRIANQYVDLRSKPNFFVGNMKRWITVSVNVILEYATRRSALTRRSAANATKIRNLIVGRKVDCSPLFVRYCHAINFKALIMNKQVKSQYFERALIDGGWA
jgi:hypothetical protein